MSTSVYPLVSVCMPAYNAAKYIGEAIESVLQQTYPNIQLVVCNDGSTDDTGNILKTFATRGNIVIANTPNRGQCAAANEAYKNAAGEYIKFFDADDILNPEHIYEQVEKLKNNNNCIAAGCIARFYNDDINNALHEPLANWKDMQPMDWLLEGNGHGLGMMQCGMFLIPRHILEKGGVWNESLSQINDFEFFPRLLLLADKVLFTEKAMVYYRSGMAGSLSNDLSGKKLSSAYTALEMTTHRLLEHENTDRVKRILSFYWNLWKYNFYLDDKTLYKGATQHIQNLGTYPDFSFRGGPYTIPNMIGWKNHKRIVLIKRKLKKLFK